MEKEIEIKHTKTVRYIIMLFLKQWAVLFYFISFNYEISINKFLSSFFFILKSIKALWIYVLNYSRKKEFSKDNSKEDLIQKEFLSSTKKYLLPKYLVVY